MPSITTFFPYTTLFRSFHGSGWVEHSDFFVRVVLVLLRSDRIDYDTLRCREAFSRDFSQSLLTSARSEEHTSELQSRGHIVCGILLEKQKLHKQLSKKR